MKEYEILILLKANLTQETYDKTFKDIEGLITNNEGEIIQHKDLGLRDLETEFKKCRQGHYVVYQFRGNNKTLEGLESKLRINENVMRYMNVTLDSVHSDIEIKETLRTEKR